MGHAAEAPMVESVTTHRWSVQATCRLAIGLIPAMVLGVGVEFAHFHISTEQPLSSRWRQSGRAVCCKNDFGRGHSSSMPFAHAGGHGWPILH